MLNKEKKEKFYVSSRLWELTFKNLKKKMRGIIRMIKKL